jgi:hypothetical protein
MARTAKRRELRDNHRFEGFTPSVTVKGVFGDSMARVIALTRRSKKRCVAPAVGNNQGGMTARFDGYAICPAAMRASTVSLSNAGCSGGTVRP